MSLLTAIAWVAPVLCPGQDEMSTLQPVERLGEHKAPIVLLSVSTDEKLIVTCAADGAIHAWDLRKEAVRWRREKRSEPVLAMDVGEEWLAFMYDQPLIFGASLLNLESGEKKTGTGFPVQGDRAVCVWIDPKGKWIWHGSKEGRMVRTVPGSPNSWSKRTLENDGVTCLAGDKKGKTLAVGGSNGTIRFVNAKGASVDKKKVFEMGSSEITALALDSGGSTVLAGCGDGSLALRSTKSGKIKAEFAGHEASIVSVAISPRGKWVASSDDSGACRLWEVKSGEQIAVVEGESGAVVLGLHFVGKSQLFGSDDNRIAVWDLSDL